MNGKVEIICPQALLNFLQAGTFIINFCGCKYARAFTAASHCHPSVIFVGRLMGFYLRVAYWPKVRVNVYTTVTSYVPK